MKQSRDITIFSTSFLDLLSCGMGAVVLLCLVFAASKKAQGDVNGETMFFTISVDSPIGPRGKPMIRVYATIDGTDIVPGETVVIRGSRLSIQPSEPGADAYRIIVTGEGFTQQDRIVVHVYDLNGLHPPELAATGASAIPTLMLQMSRSGPGGSTEQQVALPMTKPLTASLDGMETPDYEPRWE